MGRIWTRPRTPIAAQLLRPDIKPHGHVVSDPSDKWAHRLIGDWVFNERSGIFARDASGNNLRAQSAGTIGWKNGNMYFPSAASSARFVLIPDVSLGLPNDQITIFVRARKLDATARNNCLFGLDDDSVQTKRCLVHLFYSNGNTYWDFGGVSEGTSRLSFSNSGWDLDAWYGWGFSAGPRGMDIVANGELITSHSGTVPTRTASTDAWHLGYTLVSSAQQNDYIEIEYVKVYDCQLPLSDISRITRKSYRNLKSANDRVFIYAATGATEITVSTGAVVVAGVNTTIGQQQNITTTVGAVAVAGINATIGQQQNISPTVGAVVVAGVNAEVTNGQIITTTVGAVNVASVNATIGQQQNISAGVGAIAVAGVNATVTQQNAITLTTGTVVVASINATIEKAQPISVGVGAVGITGVNATIETTVSTSWTAISDETTTWTAISDETSTWENL